MFDIFGTAVYRTEMARLNEWRRFLHACVHNPAVFTSMDQISRFGTLVRYGFLSPANAYAFMIGKASPSQYARLQSFELVLNELKEFDTVNLSKFFESWQKTNPVAVEVNMSASQSVVPGFNNSELEFIDLFGDL